MNAKARRYLLLLLFSIAVRLFFYFFPFEDTSFEPVAQSHILYDIIFYSVMLSLLEVLQDRKWLIGLTWICLITSIAYSALEWFQDTYAPLTRHQYISADNFMGFIMTIFYVCIFFARKSPARIFLRCMAVPTILPYIYGIFEIIFHLPSLDSRLASPAGILVVSILLNLFLALAVLRTPALRRPQYADFLE